MVKVTCSKFMELSEGLVIWNTIANYESPFSKENNKHNESIAEAIQVLHWPQQIQICNSLKKLVYGDESELDLQLLKSKLATNFHSDMWKDSKQKSGLLYSKFQKGHYSYKNWRKLTTLELDL